MNVLRYGVIESMDNAVKCISPNKLINNDELSRLICEVNNLNKILKKSSTTPEQTLNYFGKLRQLNETISDIRKQPFAFRPTVKKYMANFINSADVVCTTLGSCAALRREYVFKFYLFIIKIQKKKQNYNFVCIDSPVL